MTADDALREEIARALVESLNIAAPLGHIFGRTTSDAAEVLVAQEIENAITHLLPIVARVEQEAYRRGRAEHIAVIRPALLKYLTETDGYMRGSHTWEPTDTDTCCPTHLAQWENRNESQRALKERRDDIVDALRSLPTN